MAIRDIPIARAGVVVGAAETSSTASVARDSAAPNLAIPTPPTTQDWTSLVQVGKVGLSADPQSGSILKLLADNGFKEKIENGSATGHIYSVWHTAPSAEFVLVDSWTDQYGAVKKHYEFF